MGTKGEQSRYIVTRADGSQVAIVESQSAAYGMCNGAALRGEPGTPWRVEHRFGLEPRQTNIARLTAAFAACLDATRRLGLAFAACTNEERAIATKQANLDSGELSSYLQAIHDTTTRPGLGSPLEYGRNDFAARQDRHRAGRLPKEND